MTIDAVFLRQWVWELLTEIDHHFTEPEDDE